MKITLKKNKVKSVVNVFIEVDADLLHCID